MNGYIGYNKRFLILELESGKVELLPIIAMLESNNQKDVYLVRTEKECFRVDQNTKTIIREN